MGSTICSYMQPSMTVAKYTRKLPLAHLLISSADYGDDVFHVLCFSLLMGSEHDC